MSGARPRRLFLVRHGDTVGQSSLRFHGRNDVVLSEVGRGQIRRLIPLVAAERFAAVICSPLSRARESADILRAALAVPSSLEVDEELREIWFGEIEGLSEPEIAERFPAWHTDWKAGRYTGFPGGETLRGFAERVAKGLDALLARWPEGDLLVVAHRGIVRQGLFHLCGGDRAQRERYVVGLGSLTIVERGASWELRSLGLEG